MVWLEFGGTAILCWSCRSNQLMFPDFVSGFWPRKMTPLLSRCAWDRENCNECGEQKEPQHCKWSQRNWAGRISLYFCECMASLPAKALPQRAGKLLWDHQFHDTFSCSACPIVSRTCGGLDGFILCYSMLLFCYGWAFFVINICWSFPSVVVFQAGYTEAIWAAALPGIRSSGEI